MSLWEAVGALLLLAAIFALLIGFFFGVALVLAWIYDHVGGGES